VHVEFGRERSGADEPDGFRRTHVLNLCWLAKAYIAVAAPPNYRAK